MLKISKIVSHIFVAGLLAATSACVYDADEGAQQTEGDVDILSEAFTESTCSGVFPGDAQTSTSTNTCTNSSGLPRYTQYAYLNSANNSYDHAACTHTFFGDYNLSFSPGTSAYWNEPLPTTETGCELLRLKARAFAYAGPYVVELTAIGGATHAGTWTPTGPSLGYCTMPPINFPAQAPIGGYAVTGVRVAVQGTTALGAGYYKVGTSAHASTCVN